MKKNLEDFNFKHNTTIPVDEFVDKSLYKPDMGYYMRKVPFGKRGDFITAPTISNLFSEIIAIWVVSSWEKLGRPSKFNFVELGPGDGRLAKVLIKTFKKFPELDKAIEFFLYEKSKYLIKIQKKKLKGFKVRWLQNFSKIKKGPIIFFGNEFFDAIPIKQFLYHDKILFEKCYKINLRFHLREIYREAKKEDIEKIKLFKIFKGHKFIEFPKLGISELSKIIKKIKNLSGGILLIDYGYLNVKNKSTIQAVMKNKKIEMEQLPKNLGKADITSLVNFKLLKEYFLKSDLKVKKIVSQKFFLEKMGIIERAKILEKNMSNKEKEYMFFTLQRLLNKDLMGDLFKVIFAFKSNNNNFLGFK